MGMSESYDELRTEIKNSDRFKDLSEEDFSKMLTEIHESIPFYISPERWWMYLLFTKDGNQILAKVNAILKKYRR